MNNKQLVRYGTVNRNMRPMVKDDILILRLSLLIIMAKACLKSYPMGEFRKKAVIENARFVFYETLVRSQSNNTTSSGQTQPRTGRHGAAGKEELFLRRAQLLAVMVNSFAKKKSKGSFRKKAMAENIELICEFLADGYRLRDTRILKVA